MSSFLAYFWSSGEEDAKTKRDEMSDLVECHKENMKKLVEEHLSDMLIAHSDQRIEEMSLEEGKTRLKVDLARFMDKSEIFKAKKEELKIKSVKVSLDQRELIYQKLIHYYEDNGFSVRKGNNGAYITIDWTPSK